MVPLGATGSLVPAGPAGPVAAPPPFGTGSVQAPPYGSSGYGESGWRQPFGQSYTVTASRVQAPQAIEEPAKDEDPVYGPLGRARGKIERAMVSDNEISLDLVDKLQQPTNELYVPPPSTSAAFNNAKLVKNIPLPDALHQELQYKHTTANMGLFEEIERAWFTVDNKLFLWDYTDGRDFSRYDQQDSTIYSVGLVRARKDVFVDDIHYLLVICTATKATLLGLSRSAKGELSLYATNMSVEAPTTMTCIRGTDSGRIFLLGVNKDIYELEYSISSGWLSSGSKVWLTNHSSGYLSTWVPSVLQGANREGVESFVVDPQQGRLYALHTKGQLEWIDVSGTKFESRSRLNNLRDHFLRARLTGALGNAGAQVVAIAPVPANESKKAAVVAIAASGARAYIGTTGFYYGGGGAFQIIATRPPPPDVAKVLPQSFYSSGTLLAVQPNTGAATASSIVTFATPAVGRQSAMRENFDNYQAPALQEWTSRILIPATVWTIAEVASTNPARASPALRREDGIDLTELAREATIAARQFLLLTNSGLFRVEQPRPIDMLEDDLEIEKEQAVIVARQAFGRVQLAGMAVLMGTSGHKRQITDLVTASVNILIAAEPPILQTSTTGTRSIIYSPRHDGLAATLARYLRPIWKAKVVATVPGPVRFKLGVSDRELLDVQGNLADLLRFLESHPFPRHQAEGDGKRAWDAEEASIEGLRLLLKQAIEAISFVLLIADYKLPDVIAKCDQATQGTLTSLSFESLLTSLGGRNVARTLVTALIELQIGQELGIDNLSAILQQRCGTFVQPGDVVLYKAEESLRRAESTRDALEREENIAESLRLFNRAAGSAARSVYPRLPDATRRYRALNDVRGTIELPLRVAAELDPQDKAGDYVRDGRNAGDPRVGFLEERQECYKLVVEVLGSYDDALDKATAAGPGQGGSSAGTPLTSATGAIRIRDEAYGLAISSNDELFHFYLYDWISALGRADQLLDFETPFIESYLRATTSNVPGRRDLLWKYYARREEYLPAAKALADMASRPSDMSLQDRVYYLAQALTNAKSAASLGAEDVEFTTGLQERLDVAHVQLEVVRAVEGHPDMTPSEKADYLVSLNADLLSLDDLYQNFARPLRLYEPILLILRTADTRVEDVVKAVWTELLKSPHPAEVTTDLCRKFYPSEGAPPDLVLPIVYGHASEVGGAPGWATRALLAGGVALRDLWDAVLALHDETPSEFYAEEAAAVLQRWLDTPRAEQDLPAAEVENFASKYILRTQGQSLDARRAETRKVMQSAKAAAGRF
ncbi:nucleoporin-domain-containing protein [Cutaneotrichosporon oleaginosum]|uniref:Nucleoporin-domain-containing protein n=1 Tax=Cutaneotrichosporon oleaginosum TaxID=879819 RepID=A0A0J1BA79_9TREE|nr:nucleoporin-domain-containing protein [Cutaneotrichosporon oleaginosum]KLT44819.1 nucleoporin-domain-containing protein [Cutaneotrichosporon oleaginosum]TXT11958.1 hypothetical protein COLE_02368 [Cutaneotrichosporon oleaginosum]